MPKEDPPPGLAASLREHLDRVERADITQAKADYAEDAVLEVDPTGEQGHPHAGTISGHEAIGHWLDNWLSSFASYRFEVREAIESGDRAFMTIDHRGLGGASGVDVEIRVYHAFTVRDGLIVRHTFSSQAREEVMRAAGIDSHRTGSPGIPEH
jgi:ketosteroid isomerase-like protein